MRFHLYHCLMQREGHTAQAYVVAPSHDAAWLTLVEHEQALGLDHHDLSLKRIDDTLKGDYRSGLDDLLDNAPVGFASFAGRWIAHTAPVQQLKLFRTQDDNGAFIHAIAPNVDVAASLFTTELGIRPGETRLLRISSCMAELPEETICNLPQLLEFGPIGLAVFNEGGWSLKD